MLQYLIICFFIVENFASKQHILGSNLKSWVNLTNEIPSDGLTTESEEMMSLINVTDETTNDPNEKSYLLSQNLRKQILNLQSLNKNESTNSLLSQILSIKPEEINKVVQLLKKLAQQAKDEINTLHKLLSVAKADEKKKTVADTNAQNALTQRITETATAKKNEKKARDLKEVTNDQLDKSKLYHKEVKYRVTSEEPGLTTELKVLNQVIALLTPISQVCPKNAILYQKYCYATMDYQKCSPNKAIGDCSTHCQGKYIPMPSGWEIAPYFNDLVQNVIIKHEFGTRCIVLSNGRSYRNAHYPNTLGEDCGGDQLVRQGNSYKARSCSRKVFMRTTNN